jgi:hypothetical protein
MQNGNTGKYGYGWGDMEDKDINYGANSIKGLEEYLNEESKAAWNTYKAENNLSGTQQDFRNFLID